MTTTRADEYFLQHDNARVFVVDDDPHLNVILEGMLQNNGNNVLCFSNGVAALEAAGKEPPDLFLLDVTMPEMSGFKVCEHLKNNPVLKDIPVIFLSGMGAMQDKIQGFHAGGVDYITKPFHFEEVKARVNTHLSLSALRTKLEYQKLVERKVRERSEAQQATIFALAKLAEYRDDDTGTHLERVGKFCRLLAEQLGRQSHYAESLSADFAECIQHASALHDIGKVAIPDNILKKPGLLTPEETSVMRTHAAVGAENLQAIFNRYNDNPFIGMGVEIALYHHERWDGTGYPGGIAGKEIPISARIMAVADFYDALRTDRCYRKGLGHETVRNMLLERSGTYFDPEIIEAFFVLEEQFSAIMDKLGHERTL